MVTAIGTQITPLGPEFLGLLYNTVKAVNIEYVIDNLLVLETRKKGVVVMSSLGQAGM
jgi:hypothetical protein